VSVLSKGSALFCVFVCLSFSPHAIPQTVGHSVVDVSGIVFSESGSRRIAYALVRLCGEDQRALQELSTGDSGEFEFQGLQRGHFMLQVRALGFELSEVAVDLSFVSTHGLSIFLKPAKNSAANIPVGPTVSAHELSMPQRARELVAAGEEKFYTGKNPEKALRDFQSAVSEAPAYYEAYHQIGLVYLALQKPAEAEKSFRKSVELSHGEYANADILLSSLLLDRGDTVNGEPLLKNGLALNPDSWMGQYLLGKQELSRGNYSAALQSARQAVRLAPDKLLPHRLLAILYLQQKDYPALLKELDAYIALDPNSPAGVRAKELRGQAQQALSGLAPTTVGEK
jgi:tetratricopeptide (TPR) repeat protein